MTVAILFAAAAVYIMLTPHKEIALIREGNNAAALSLAGVLVGLAIPLAISLKASTTLIELGLWGVAIMVGGAAADLPARGPGAAWPSETHSRMARWPPPPLLVGAKLATALILAAAVAGLSLPCAISPEGFPRRTG